MIHGNNLGSKSLLFNPSRHLTSSSFNEPDITFGRQRELIDKKLERADPVDYLDKDTFLLIFSQLDSRDLGRLAVCSKKWNEVASADAFWQLEYSKKFGRRSNPS